MILSLPTTMRGKIHKSKRGDVIKFTRLKISRIKEYAAAYSEKHRKATLFGLGILISIHHFQKQHITQIDKICMPHFTEIKIIHTNFTAYKNSIQGGKKH